MGSKETPAARGRLLSLDAFRGFDMMFIMGFAAIVQAVCRLFPGGDTSWLCQQMSHSAWDGLRLYDTIFPTFLFIAGISFPFSLAAQRSRGATQGQVYAKIFRRALILVLLGLVYNGLFGLKFSTLRFPSPSHVHLFATLWIAAHQAYLSLTIFRSLSNFMFLLAKSKCSI